MYDLKGASWNVGGENKMKAQFCQFIFLVGPIFTSSAGSSTVEYSGCALSEAIPDHFGNKIRVMTF